MKRSELIRSREYWITDIQLKLFNLIENYRSKKGLTKTQIAEKLGVTKGYVTQVLNGDFDHKMSKLVDLAIAFDKVPLLQFVDAPEYLRNETAYMADPTGEKPRPIQYNTYLVVSSGFNDLKKYLPGATVPATETPFAVQN
jgi:transcriptional regulator with XRE-family HTH domain